MTPLPKRRKTRGKSNIRRGAKALKLPSLTTCKSCGAKKYPHKRCPSCNK